MQEGVAPVVVEEEDSGPSLKIEGSYSVNPMFSGHFLAPSLGWDVGETGGHLYDSAGDSDHSSSYDAVDKDGAPIMQFNQKHVGEEEVVMLDEDGEDIVELEDGEGDSIEDKTQGGNHEELSIEKCLNRGYVHHSSSALTSSDPKIDAQINEDIVEEADDEDAILGI